jgi:hypothetical protein
MIPLTVLITSSKKAKKQEEMIPQNDNDLGTSTTLSDTTIDPKNSLFDRETLLFQIRKMLANSTKETKIEEVVKTTEIKISEEDIEISVENNDLPVKIEYGSTGDIQYGGNGDSIHQYHLASEMGEMYGLPVETGVNYETLFAHMGKKKVANGSLADEETYVHNNDTVEMEIGALEGEQAQSIIDRLYVRAEFNDTTAVTPEEQDKYKYWKWFNRAERKLYEALSPLRQTPYWQLAET